MKVKSYVRLIKILRYAPLAILAVSLLLRGADVEVTGDRIPKGEDPSIF